jgi:flagellar motor switch protein FliG
MPDVDLTGSQKAAALLITLGPEASSNVLKHLDEDEIEQITMHIFNMEAVAGAVKDEVLRQCYSMSFVGEGGAPAGGMEFARDLLSRALGNQKAVEFMDRVRARSQGAPFDFLEDADAAQLANSLKNEHPQAIALILSHLKVAKAASVIAHLGERLQGDVSTRIAVMDRVSPDVIKAVEAGVKGKLSTVLTQDYATSGGVSALVSILHQVDRATEKTIMDALDEEQPQLAEEVRQKMFMFENIVALDGRTIQRILRDVENKDLILALKGASEEVRRLIFANMSTRAAALLKEDLAIVGPVRLRDVEEAQQRIVAVIRQLEAAEEIVISRGGEDQIIT